MKVKVKEFAVRCGNYRTFIVKGKDKADACRNFDLARQENVLSTMGFDSKDITKVDSIFYTIND